MCDVVAWWLVFVLICLRGEVTVRKVSALEKCSLLDLYVMTLPVTHPCQGHVIGTMNRPNGADNTVNYLGTNNIYGVMVVATA